MKQRLLTTLTACLLALSSWAYGTKIGSIYYDLDSSTKTASVTYTGTSSFNPESTAYTGDITIPATITYNGTTYSVTSIGGWAFYDCTGLTSITIPNSVTSIGQSAFSGCTGLTSVTIPNSVTRIENGAFSYCPGLTSVNVVAGNTKYDSRDNCNAIIEKASNTLIAGCKNTTIPNSVTTIGKSAFSGCTGLTSITIPNSVTGIGAQAFYRCTGLTSVTIPNSVTTIGSEAFYRCTGLTSLTIPNSVTSIGYRAFYDCKGLTSLTIPNSVTSIASEAFASCTLNPLIICGKGTSKFSSSNGKITTFLNLNEKSHIYVEDASIVSTLQKYFANVSAIAPELSTTNYIQGIRIKVDNPLIYGEAGTPPVIKSVNIKPNSGAGWEIEGLQVGIDTLITGLKPSTTYNITITYANEGGEEQTVSKSVKTNAKEIYNFGSSTTQTTARIYNISARTDMTTGRVIATGYAMGSSYYTANDVFYSTETVTGLTPNTKYAFQVWAMYEDKTMVSAGTYLTTKGVSPSVGVTVTPSTATLRGTYTEGDAHVSSAVFSLGSKTLDSNTLTGLKPSTKYTLTYTVKTQEGSTETVTKDFTTTALTMTTQQPKVISVGNVIVAAETNLDEAETSVGFEWRRTDWSDDFTSNSGGAYLYGGTMEGYIRNLYTEKLWKYRPYYEAADGTRYYGEWVGIDPTNTSYFEPTVHTYATVSVDGNSASVKGYAMRGTDNVAQQGFKYWKISSSTRGLDEDGARLMAVDIPADAMTVTGSGQVMAATLTGLEYNTDYCCVAFVTTSEGETFYGEQQTFRTGEDVTGIGHVTLTGESSTLPEVVGYYNLQGQRLTEPQRGIVIIRYSDGTSRKVLVK